jgi:hypothetical protein
MKIVLLGRAAVKKGAEMGLKAKETMDKEALRIGA